MATAFLLSKATFKTFELASMSRTEVASYWG
jgi:hypothetical protein